MAGFLTRLRGRPAAEALPPPEALEPPPPPPSVWISFHAEVNPTTSEALLSVVAQQVNEGRKDIHLMLTTPGGIVANGLGIYNTLRALPITLTTYNVGSVNSIGNIIYLAGERRCASRSSSFMFHGVGFDIMGRTRFEERILLEHLDAIRTDQRLLAAIIAERTGIGPEEAEGLFLRQAFVASDEAKARGIVHEVCDISVPEGVPFLQLVFQR
jgi:ATP-dependent protease ClpP protease subunit